MALSAIRAKENYDASFELAEDNRTALNELLGSDTFCAQVRSSQARPAPLVTCMCVHAQACRSLTPQTERQALLTVYEGDHGSRH